jgi:hypothetical protein
MKKPPTAYRAKVIAEALATYPNPKKAADKMILMGWTGIDPYKPKEKRYLRAHEREYGLPAACLREVTDDEEKFPQPHERERVD